MFLTLKSLYFMSKTTKFMLECIKNEFVYMHKLLELLFHIKPNKQATIIKCRNMKYVHIIVLIPGLFLINLVICLPDMQ
jgi:hypothetical protein